VYVARMGSLRNLYRLVFWKPRGKTPLGRPKCRWENNTEVNRKEIGWEGVD